MYVDLDCKVCQVRAEAAPELRFVLFHIPKTKGRKSFFSVCWDCLDSVPVNLAMWREVPAWMSEAAAPARLCGKFAVSTGRPCMIELDPLGHCHVHDRVTITLRNRKPRKDRRVRKARRSYRV